MLIVDAMYAALMKETNARKSQGSLPLSPSKMVARNG